VFGTNLEWHSNYWKAAGVSFGNLDNTMPRLDPSKVMKQPFLDFAKAYFRYQQGHKPTGAKLEMRALKCTERALDDCDEGPDVLRIHSGVLDRAAVLVRAHFRPGTAYHIGRELARLATFLSEKNMIPLCLDWKSPIARPTDTVRTGVKAREEREKKLPSTEALDALATIFAEDPRESRDIFTTCTAAMLLCAPSRVSEVLALPADCEVWETKRDGTRAYGWRFQPGKGGAPMIKWIPDAMACLAQEAIRRVRVMTVEARRIASWLENNPDMFYRHAACPDVAENEPLSIEQAAKAIGTPCNYSTKVELRRFGLPDHDGGNTLATLNQWVHGRLPSSFPWFDKERGVRFSEALFCLREKQLRTDMPASVFMIWKPTNNVVNSDLGRVGGSDGYFQPSIFDRRNRNTPGQSPLKVTSHQFRHHLDTIAQRGGLSQSEVARWAGRTDMKQNRVYDHMSEFELVDMIRHNDSTLTLDRPLAEIAENIATQIPMTRQEFNTLTMPTAHVTDFGFCVHNFVMAPCQRFRDCLNCSEQICIKGDKRLDRIRVRYAQIRQLKERAEEAIANGSAGADRWYEIQSLTETRLAALIAILEDPSIEDGAIIRLRNDNEFSPLRRVLEAKAIAERRSNKQLSVLNNLHRLTEGAVG
jgi:hypothetical protein